MPIHVMVSRARWRRALVPPTRLGKEWSRGPRAANHLTAHAVSWWGLPRIGAWLPGYKHHLCVSAALRLYVKNRRAKTDGRSRGATRHGRRYPSATAAPYVGVRRTAARWHARPPPSPPPAGGLGETICFPRPATRGQRSEFLPVDGGLGEATGHRRPRAANHLTAHAANRHAVMGRANPTAPVIHA